MTLVHPWVIIREIRILDDFFLHHYLLHTGIIAMPELVTVETHKTTKKTLARGMASLSASITARSSLQGLVDLFFGLREVVDLPLLSCGTFLRCRWLDVHGDSLPYLLIYAHIASIPLTWVPRPAVPAPLLLSPLLVVVCHPCSALPFLVLESSSS